MLRAISTTGSMTEEQLKVLQGMNHGKRSQSLASFAKHMGKSGSAAGHMLSSKLLSGKHGSGKLGSGKLGSGRLSSMKVGSMKMGRLPRNISLGSVGSMRSAGSLTAQRSEGSTLKRRSREVGRGRASRDLAHVSRESGTLGGAGGSFKGGRAVGEGLEGKEAAAAAAAAAVGLGVAGAGASRGSCARVPPSPVPPLQLDGLVRQQPSLRTSPPPPSAAARAPTVQGEATPGEFGQEHHPSQLPHTSPMPEYFPPDAGHSPAPAAAAAARGVAGHASHGGASSGGAAPLHALPPRAPRASSSGAARAAAVPVLPLAELIAHGSLSGIGSAHSSRASTAREAGEVPYTARDIELQLEQLSARAGGTLDGQQAQQQHQEADQRQPHFSPPARLPPAPPPRRDSSAAASSAHSEPRTPPPRTLAGTFGEFLTGSLRRTAPHTTRDVQVAVGSSASSQVLEPRHPQVRCMCVCVHVWVRSCTSALHAGVKGIFGEPNRSCVYVPPCTLRQVS